MISVCLLMMWVFVHDKREFVKDKWTLVKGKVCKQTTHVLQTTREQLFGRLLGGSLGVNRATERNLDGRRLLGPHVNQIVVAPAEIRLLSDGSQCEVVLGVGGGVDEAAR